MINDHDHPPGGRDNYCFGLLVGVFGLVGNYAAGAPAFMATLAQHLGPSFVPYIFTAAGPLALLPFAATAYLIHRGHMTQKVS